MDFLLGSNARFQARAAQLMGELLAPVRAIPLLAGEINCARSALAILRRRAADDRPEVIDEM